MFFFTAKKNQKARGPLNSLFCFHYLLSAEFAQGQFAFHFLRISPTQVAVYCITVIHSKVHSPSRWLWSGSDRRGPQSCLASYFLLLTSCFLLFSFIQIKSLDLVLLSYSFTLLLSVFAARTVAAHNPSFSFAIHYYLLKKKCIGKATEICLSIPSTDGTSKLLFRFQDLLVEKSFGCENVGHARPN